MSDITAQDTSVDTSTADTAATTQDLPQIDHSHDEIISQLDALQPTLEVAQDAPADEAAPVEEVSDDDTTGLQENLDSVISDAQAAYEENLAALPQELSVFKSGQFVTERIYVTDTLVAEAVTAMMDDPQDDSLNGHVYGIINPDREFLARNGQTFGGGIQFQMGPVPEAGVNGFTSEVMLAVLIHRTKVLNGKYPCAENETAIAAMQAALDAFNARTVNREARGVEGTNQA